MRNKNKRQITSAGHPIDPTTHFEPQFQQANDFQIEKIIFVSDAQAINLYRTTIFSYFQLQLSSKS